MCSAWLGQLFRISASLLQFSLALPFLWTVRSGGGRSSTRRIPLRELTAAAAAADDDDGLYEW